MFGHLTRKMKKILPQYIVGKELWDLGAGKLGHSFALLKAGAASVVAVDKDPGTKKHPLLRTIRGYFDQVAVPEKGIEVAFVSWPSNHHLPGLLALLEVSQVVIYLGSNTDGTSCGWSGLFRHLTRRELLAHVPDKLNSLIICGGQLQRARPPTPEEIAALHGSMMSFDQAREKAEQLVGKLDRREKATKLLTDLCVDHFSEGIKHLGRR